MEYAESRSWNSSSCTVLEDVLMVRVDLKKVFPKLSTALLPHTCALELRCLVSIQHPLTSARPPLGLRTDLSLTCTVGQDQKQALRLHLRLGQEQGAHLSLFLLT